MKKIKVPAEKVAETVSALNREMCTRVVFVNIATKPHKQPGYTWVIIG